MSNIQLVEQTNLPAQPEVFVVQYAPLSCLKQFSKANTPALCVDSGTPSLGQIRKAYDLDFALAYIELWIDNLNDFVNAARRMSPAQMQETAAILFQEYPYLNIADINLVFRRIKKGEFGQLFAEIDGIKILGWFSIYDQERRRICADRELSNHQRFSDNFKRSSNREAEKIANIRAMGFHTIENAKK